MPNVTLAVRIRPFTERELKSEKDSCRVVNVVDDKTISIINIKVSVSGAGDSRERVRRYTADHTFDSAATTDTHASQDTVFRGVGREVLQCASRGQSACVLAYGQSATGKTHTMMGTDAQPGLVPRICRALAEEHGPEFGVTVSFLEIYNERVHDLLAGEEPPGDCCSLPRRRGNSRKDLRVREHPGKGPYVQNLRRVLVHDAQALLALVSDGSRRRRTAATRRNPASSRSHALLELHTPRATLHLADLAGSEKAGWEGCGGRQKEGANINKSLVALSNVISALVSVGSGRGRFVPYRDSALTWLLKDCFTGGARTFIIATVSPSVSCYGESASTLRWAARARQLPEPRAPALQVQSSKAAVQAQLNKLLAELARHYIQYIPETGQISYSENHWGLRIPAVVDKADSMYSIRAKPDGQNSESTTSSVASGSSDVINVGSNVNINKEISKEVDKLFGPALERAKSGSDIQLVPPMRNKRRQYRSQEVLIGDKPLSSKTVKEPTKNSKTHLHIDDETITLTESASDKTETPVHVPIFYDNTQRAEIVASVTDRLYSKLKKKEESTIAKMEHAVDKKIMEPLSELRICTNARQRLVELSQRALRNKRRIIGIPAHTQTKKQVIRVRDQGIDVQTDLQPYFIKERHILTPHTDVGTETISMTPRCKEIAVGPLYGSIKLNDNSTITDVKRVQYKTTSVMTDDIHKLDRCTQTIIAPPRRKKKITKTNKFCSDNNTPIININISHTYPDDSDSASAERASGSVNNRNVTVFPITPDLLTNHSSGDAGEITNDEKNATDLSSDSLEEGENKANMKLQSNSSVDLNKNGNGDFPDECCSLPRVKVESIPSTSSKELRNMILGHSSDVYPYNIILSPPTERESKRTVKFKDFDTQNGYHTCNPEDTMISEPNPSNDNSDLSSYEKAPSVLSKSSHSERTQSRSSSDCTDSSKASDSFIWKRGPNYPDTTRSFGSLHKTQYVPVYKHNTTRHRTAKTKMYRQFLGLEKDDCQTADSNHSSTHDEQDDSEHVFRKTRQFFEEICHDDSIRKSREYDEMERNALRSCDLIDASVNKYERFLTKQKERNRVNSGARKPTEYLRHLVDIRRMLVEDSDNATSMDESKNFF